MPITIAKTTIRCNEKISGLRSFQILTSLALLLLTACTSVPPAPINVRADWPAIKIELEKMHESDQTLRKEMIARQTEARSKGVTIDKDAQAALSRKIGEQDRSNQQRVAAIIDAYGWPPRSKVGYMAALAAFLIVQHADLDFQIKYISLMRAAVAAGEAGKSDFALLEDRVLVRQGKLQRYGSQLKTIDGVTALDPIEDEANLDARRAEMELEPMCKYLERFTKSSGRVKYAPCETFAAGK